LDIIKGAGSVLSSTIVYWTGGRKVIPKGVNERNHCHVSCYYFCMHCKTKPCKAYRELPVSQFSQGKTFFHYRESLFSLQGSCFHCKDFPVNPCTSLLGIAVWVRSYLEINQGFTKSDSRKNTFLFFTKN
jgi:hypothetical protein